MAARAVRANVMFCELTGGSEKRARALLTGIVSGRCARDVTCESRVKGCPSTLSEDQKDPNDNGVVHTVAKIIKAVMSSAAKAELGGSSSMPRRLYQFAKLLKNWDIRTTTNPNPD